MILPSNNPITLGFGATDSPYSKTSPHRGVDFGYLDEVGNKNLTILMPEDGTVTLVPNNGNDGNGVYFTVGDHFHGLLHTSKYLVSNGQYVRKGTPVAIMGDTGAAEGVHLHWALKVQGTFVNALNYVDEHTKGDDVKIQNPQESEWFYTLVWHRKPSKEEAEGMVGKTLEELFYQATQKDKDKDEWHHENDILLRAWPELTQHAQDLQNELQKAETSNEADEILTAMQDTINKYKEK
jgi:hypothetical protein